MSYKLKARKRSAVPGTDHLWVRGTVSTDAFRFTNRYARRSQF